MCSNLEGLVKRFIVMVQRGHDPLVDILLTGWWWNKWESASSTFWFQVVWGLHVCGKHTVNFSHLVGFSDLQNSSKILLCISLERGSGHCPKAALFCVCVGVRGAGRGRLFWLFFPLSLYHLPSLVSNCWTHSLEFRESRILNEDYFL